MDICYKYLSKFAAVDGLKHITAAKLLPFAKHGCSTSGAIGRCSTPMLNTPRHRPMLNMDVELSPMFNVDDGSMFNTAHVQHGINIGAIYG